MSSDVAIKVSNLSKCYHIYDRPHDRLKQSIYPRLQRIVRKQPTQYYREFWALRDVSFEIKRGETVGIIGRNGSGKSTLLQIISGTLSPSGGSVQTNGRIAALLELGSGFNPEFTGRENVYLNGALLGLSKEEVDDRFEAIVAFADIGDFIEQPVKTYSSGMFVRLAFAVIAHVDADILIIDEALAVGDAYFVQKCMRFLRGFTQHGTLLLVSHDTSAVVGVCSSAMLMNTGQLERIGNPKDISEHYLAMLHDDQIDLCQANPITPFVDATGEEHTPKSDESNDFGTGAATILAVKLAKEDGSALAFLRGGEVVNLDVRCRANIPFSDALIGFLVRDRLGQVIFGSNTGCSTANLGGLEKDQIIDVRFTFEMPCLQQGTYSASVAIGQGTQDEHTHHHWVHDALLLELLPTTRCFGMLATKMKAITHSTGAKFP